MQWPFGTEDKVTAPMKLELDLSTGHWTTGFRVSLKLDCVRIAPPVGNCNAGCFDTSEGRTRSLSRSGLGFICNGGVALLQPPELVYCLAQSQAEGGGSHGGA